MTILTNRKRSLRVCLLNQEPRIIDRYLAAIEKEITKIYAVDVIKIESIEDQDLKPCDLLILIAHTLDENHFTTWIKGLTKRMEKNNLVAIPALVVCNNIDPTALGLMEFAIDENWYFDIIDVNHISSMSIRAANLIRIHDHIHELGRYENAIKGLEKQVKDLENKI